MPAVHLETNPPLFGFSFVNETDMSRVAEHILGPQPDDGRLPFVVTPNVDYVVRLEEPRLVALGRTLRRARYVLPDGQPIVWVSRFAGPPLASRLPGSTLFPIVWQQIVRARRPAVVVAASEETAVRLTREHPCVRTIVPPHFEVDDAAQLDAITDACVEAIREIDAEFVLIGISFPKQQHIALSVLDRLGSDARPPLFMMLGGSFEMYLGEIKRAPQWMQRSGTEWLYRFVKEPRRLFRRYFVTDMRFVLCATRELLWHRRRRPE